MSAPTSVVGGDEEEDDYLTMSFDTPTSKSTARQETTLQRRARQKREAESRARTKTKAELLEEAERKRLEVLETSTVNEESKAFKMMKKMGYKTGEALGKSNGGSSADKIQDGICGTRGLDNRLKVPLGVEIKLDKGGIGADTEKKRKIREEFETRDTGEKKRKVAAEDFRVRNQLEREEKRAEGQCWAAMKICAQLEEESEYTGEASEQDKKDKRRQLEQRPLKGINVLWRSLVKIQRTGEREKRLKTDLRDWAHTRVNATDSDAYDELAVPLTTRKKEDIEVVDYAELDETDEECDEFEELESPERLARLVKYLRDVWHYCFWCKHRYKNDKMDGCPGLTEDEHG